MKTIKLHGSAIIRDSEGRVLLIRRAPHDSSPGMWELPGGCFEMQDQDISITATARRETKEETGLKVKIGGLLAQMDFDRADDVIRFYIFTAEMEDQKQKVQLSDEHDDHFWASPERLLDYQIIPGLRRAMYEILLKMRHERRTTTSIRNIIELMLVERAYAMSDRGEDPRVPAEWIMAIEEKLEKCKWQIARCSNNKVVLDEMVQVLADVFGCLLEHGANLRSELSIHRRTFDKLREHGWDYLIGDLNRATAPTIT